MYKMLREYGSNWNTKSPKIYSWWFCPKAIAFCNVMQIGKYMTNNDYLHYSEGSILFLGAFGNKLNFEFW